MHTLIYPFIGPATNHCPENELCHLRAMECSNVHIILPQVIALLLMQMSIYKLLTSIMNKFQQTQWTVFLTQAHCGKPMFSPFVNFILTKTCISIHITYYSVNFKCFSLLSHKKFDNRSPFKPGSLFYLKPF